MALLLTTADLPTDFTYPRTFVRVVELGLTDLEPWEIVEGDDLSRRFAGLQSRYPSRRYIPFARRQDNDDVVCWDLDEPDLRVVVVHDFASAGWERRERRHFHDFNAWLRQAVEDLIEWGSYEDPSR